MRIWSIHPKYLDAKGLVALWRETLLAKKVLEGRTIGYKNHPQLLRFKNAEQTLPNINFYLQTVWEEAKERGYSFDKNKFIPDERVKSMPVTSGQIAYEIKHLHSKLKKRDPGKYNLIKNDANIFPHPLFSIISGPVEVWEKYQ